MAMFLRRNNGVLIFAVTVLFVSTGSANQLTARWPSVAWRRDMDVVIGKIDSLEFKPPAKRLIASVTPSIAEIIDDLKASRPQGTLVSRKDLVEALTRAADGKEGPLLVVSNGSKLRIMELRPKAADSVTP